MRVYFEDRVACTIICISCCKAAASCPSPLMSIAAAMAALMQLLTMSSMNVPDMVQVCFECVCVSCDSADKMVTVTYQPDSD